jgi:hypothetical protein
VVRAGTSKVSTISQHGSSTSGALVTGALQKEEEEDTFGVKVQVTETEIITTCCVL